MAWNIEFQYFTIDSADGQDSLMTRSMEAFGRFCRLPPLNGAISVIPVEPEMQAAVSALFANSREPLGNAIDLFVASRLNRGLKRPKVVVGTRPGSIVASRCLELNPNAEWGIAISETIAVVYGDPRESLIWHEAFHLLGADDCYDVENPEERPGPLCESPKCIMGFEPMDVAESDWPFLCDANIRKVREGFGFDLPPTR